MAGYKIYLSLSGVTPTVTSTPIATVGPTRTSRNNYVAAAAGSTGVYSVSAIDGFGNASDMSAPSTVNLNNLPIGVINAPQAPHLINTTQSGNSLTYTWLLNSQLDNVTSYSIYDSNYVSYIATTTITPTVVATVLTPSYTLSALSYWQPMPYYLVANNFLATSTPGISLPATLAALPVPTYVVTAVVQPTQGVNVSWNMAPPAVATPYVDSVVIYRALERPALTPYFRPIATVLVSTSTYLDANVTPGTQYSYMVTGRSNNFVNGTPTPMFESSVSVTGIAYPTVITWPNVPAGFSANTGSNATTLYWTPNPTTDSVQSYTVLRNGITTATPIMTPVFAETPGSTSVYQVFANNAGGSSTGSAAITVLAIPSMTPTVSVNTPTWYTPVASQTPMVWISGLTYPPGSAVQGYTIYRATDSAFVTGVPVATVVAPTTFVTDPGQTGYINYYKAVANTGAGGVTANFTLSGLIGINLWPNPPSSFLASASANAVTLSWSAPTTGSSPVTAYDIYQGTASGAETLLAPVPSLGGSYPITQVTPGVVYYYYMNSIGGGLNSAPTSEQAVIPGPAPILNGVASNGQALLTWSPVAVATTSPITEYVVSKLTMPTPGSSVPAPTYPFTTSNLTTNSYSDSAIAYNTGYAYKVAPIAIATTGATIYGSYSNPVTVLESPQGPTNVVAVSGDQLVQLRWNYQGTFANNTYSIQRKLGTAPVSAYQTIASGLNGVDYTDTGLLDKTLYNYQIIAVPTASATLTGTSQPVNALPAKPPVIDSAALTLTQNQSGNTISWLAANSNLNDFVPATMYPLGGYSIYRSDDGGGTYQFLQSQGVSLTSYIDPVTIINGSSYTYEVFAFDAPPNVNTNNPNMIHQSVYGTITAAGLTESVALDRNSLRPFGASNEQVVHVRFVVTAPTNVQIKVYTLSGVFVKQLVNQSFGTGIYGIASSSYPLVWDGHNASGDLVASGVYLITTEMNGLQTIDKIAVIK